MATSKPLPRIGVDMLYYAPLTSDTADGTVYGDPVKLPGVTAVTFNPNSEVASYYADDGVYEVFSQTGEIEMEFTLANLSPEDQAFLLGASYANGVVSDGNADVSPDVAIMYRSQKSNGEYVYYTVYSGKFAKPEENSNTKADAVEFQEKTLMFKAASRLSDNKYRRYVESDDENLPAGVDNDTLANVTSGWFSDPDYVVAATTSPIDDLAATTGSSGGEIDITFTAATGATSLTVQVADPATGLYADATTSAALDDTSTSAVITGLTESNEYNVRIIVNGGTKAGISNVDSATAGVTT